MTCTVVQEQEQPRLYDVVSGAVRSGDAFAVLDPTWPQSFLGMAAGQIDDAVSGGLVRTGDMVVFSSGSTGRPRGIVRTFESWQISFALFSDIAGLTAQDTVWLPGPLWSSLFLYGALHAGSVGAKVVFRDDDPSSATALHCVPSQLPGLLLRARSGELASVRLAVVAGDHLSASMRERCERAGWRVLEYYGAAELSLVSCRDRAGAFRAFPGVETELRDGALWARSPYLSRGYLATASSQAEKTDGPEKTGGPFRLDSEGWATVGDMARPVGDGVEVLGRGDGAVTTGGHTVIVEEVERLLRGIEGVDDVAVLGVPHARIGQVLTAIVVGPVDDARLRAAVAVMPSPSRPRRWVHADALPRTSGGKLRRGALPELVAKLRQP